MKRIILYPFLKKVSDLNNIFCNNYNSWKKYSISVRICTTISIRLIRYWLTKNKVILSSSNMSDVWYFPWLFSKNASTAWHSSGSNSINSLYHSYLVFYRELRLFLFSRQYTRVFLIKPFTKYSLSAHKPLVCGAAGTFLTV